MISSENNKIRQFRCKNCGGEIQLQNKRTQYVACQYCGSVSEADSEAGQILTKMANPGKYPTMSFIKLGMEGTFRGKRHHVIGRTRRKNTYKEFWAEDGESGYSDETWIFDEWLLISEDGTYFTIVEDSEGYNIVNPVVPKYPSLPSRKKMQDFFQDKLRRVREYGDTEIMYYEGESTYLVQAGFKSKFSQYNLGGKAYIAEWRYENEDVKEIEFFEEVPVSANQLKNAFGIIVKDTKSSKKNKSSRKKGIKNRYIVLAAGIINILIEIIAPSSYKFSDLLNKEGALLQEAKVQGWKNIGDTLKGVSFEDTVSLNPDTKMLHIYYGYNLPNYSRALIELMFFDKNNDTIFYSYKYGYHYIYSDSVQYEYTPHMLSYYDVDDSPRDFNIRFSISVPKNWKPKNVNDDIKARLFIDELKKPQARFSAFGFTLIVISIFYIIFKGVLSLFKRKEKETVL